MEHWEDDGAGTWTRRVQAPPRPRIAGVDAMVYLDGVQSRDGAVGWSLYVHVDDRENLTADQVRALAASLFRGGRRELGTGCLSTAHEARMVRKLRRPGVWRLIQRRNVFELREGGAVLITGIPAESWAPKIAPEFCLSLAAARQSESRVVCFRRKCVSYR